MKNQMAKVHQCDAHKGFSNASMKSRWKAIAISAEYIYYSLSLISGIPKSEAFPKADRFGTLPSVPADISPLSDPAIARIHITAQQSLFLSLTDKTSFSLYRNAKTLARSLSLSLFSALESNSYHLCFSASKLMKMVFWIPRFLGKWRRRRRRSRERERERRRNV